MKKSFWVVSVKEKIGPAIRDFLDGRQTRYAVRTAAPSKYEREAGLRYTGEDESDWLFMVFDERVKELIETIVKITK